MRKIQIIHDRVHIGERFAISFQRTLRIPDDGKTYPLPPSLGAFPVKMASDYPDKAPPTWQSQGGYSVFIPMYQREAMWLAFAAAGWKPNAVQIGLGGINALTGKPWSKSLHIHPQNYVICPDQPWLDGINAGEGIIRQFVAMPLGMGYTVEGQLTGEEKTGGLQVRVFEPKPGFFPDQPPPSPAYGPGPGAPLALQSAPAKEMGLGAGGQMEQKIYPDSYGVEVWLQEDPGELFVYIVNSIQYEAITGEQPPPTPISAQTYTDYGFPWFKLYDEARGDIVRSKILAGLKTIQEIDSEKEIQPEDDEIVEIDPVQIKDIHPQDRRQ